MGRKVGRMKLEEIKLEGGVIVPVSLDKETGTFHAEYLETFSGENETHQFNEHWQDKDLEKLRIQVREWARTQRKLDWKPVIVLHRTVDGWNSRVKSVLGCGFERLMRAKKLKGEGYEWRGWALTAPDRNFIYDTDLDVYPPSGHASEPKAYRHNDREPIVIEYTPERWLALFRLIEMEKALQAKLEEIFGSGEKRLDLFFSKLQDGGLLAFNDPTKEKSKED